MKIAIRIATYQRKDGKTPLFLKRALDSILSQTHQDFKVFLIGDRYDNEEEFLSLSKIINKEKIYVENLSVAVEREKYPAGDIRLWCAGGVHATNHAIEKIQKESIKWACNLDHDDWWEPDHLKNINDVIENECDKDTVFVATRSTYLGREILPRNYQAGRGYFPTAGNLIHSSICAKWSEIPLRFRDVFEIEGRYHAGDADMWERLSSYMMSNGKNGYLIDKPTCHHDEEGR